MGDSTHLSENSRMISHRRSHNLHALTAQHANAHSRTHAQAHERASTQEREALPERKARAHSEVWVRGSPAHPCGKEAAAGAPVRGLHGEQGEKEKGTEQKGKIATGSTRSGARSCLET